MTCKVNNYAGPRVLSPVFSLLTFNTALLDVKLLQRSVYNPVPGVNRRLSHMIPALQSLSPDILVLQEMFHGAHQRQLADALLPGLPHSAGISRHRPAARLGTELLTLSRFPVTDVGHTRFRHAPWEEIIFTSRGFHHCEVDIPAIGKVNLVNFHATAGGINAHPEDDRLEIMRSRQIRQLVAYTGQMDLVILAGDLNAGPHSSTGNYRELLQAGFVDTYMNRRNEGYTWDPRNPLVATGTEHHLQAQRIDHIFINSGLADILQPRRSEVVLQTVSHGSAASPLSDHYGLVTSFTVK